MSDLHRFARQLVASLGAHAPAALAAPVPLADVMERVLPYRAARRLLQILNVEDYETLLLRLVAGEGGLADAIPSSAAERCRAELDTGHPDLRVLQDLGEVSLRLHLGAIAVGALVDEEAPRAIRRSYSLADLDEPAPPADAHQPAAVEPTSEPAPVLADITEPVPSAPGDSAGSVAMAPDADARVETTELDVPGHASTGVRDLTEGAVAASPPESEPDREPDVVAVPVETPPLNPEPVEAVPPPAGEPVEGVPTSAREPVEAEATAPPSPPYASPREAEPAALAMPSAPAAYPEPPPRCPHCASRLPAGRPVRFCPHCGSNVVPLQCPRCSADLEPSWRHCVLCGAPVMHDSRFA